MVEINLNDDSIQILTQTEWIELVNEKTVARQKILSLVPIDAQMKLNKIIDPNLLEPDFKWHLEFNSLSLNNDEIED
jgi:hypothetical protein